MNYELIATAVKGILMLKSFGLRFAAEFLKQRGFTPEQAVDVLIRRKVC